VHRFKLPAPSGLSKGVRRGPAHGGLLSLFPAHPIALSLAAFLRSQLILVNTLDPFSFLAAVAVISVMTLLAAWLPARRATKVNPMTALRCD
jgi:ABC-type antimicrobial peptide transport system permease subunit